MHKTFSNDEVFLWLKMKWNMANVSSVLNEGCSVHGTSFSCLHSYLEVAYFMLESTHQTQQTSSDALILCIKSFRIHRYEL